MEAGQRMENAGRLDGGYEPTGVETMMSRRLSRHPVTVHETV
jgi:hypothetical protein